MGATTSSAASSGGEENTVGVAAHVPRTVAVPIGASLTPQERNAFLKDAQTVLMQRLLLVFETFIALENQASASAGVDQGQHGQTHGQTHAHAMKRFYLAQIYQALNRLKDPSLPTAFVKALFRPLTRLIMCDDASIRRQLVLVFEKIGFEET